MDFILGFIGLVILIKGSVRIPFKNVTVSSDRARGMGCLLMLPVVVGLVMGFIVGASSRGASVSTIVSRVMVWVLLAYAVGIGGFILLAVTASESDYPDWLPLDQAARYTQLSPQKILDLISNGTLKAAADGGKYVIERRALDRIKDTVEELPKMGPITD